MKRSDLSWSAVSTGQRLHGVGVIADGGDRMHIIMGTDHRRWAAIRGGWELSHLDESDLRCTGLEGSNLRKIDRRSF